MKFIFKLFAIQMFSILCNASQSPRPKPLCIPRKTTCFLIISDGSEAAKEWIDYIKKTLQRGDDEVIVSEDKNAEINKKEHLCDYSITLNCYESIPEGFLTRVSHAIKSDPSAEGFYIPIKTYQIDENGKLIIKTENQLRITKNFNTEPTVRQKKNSELNDIVIYRDPSRLINSIIYNIRNKNSRALYFLLRQEGALEFIISKINRDKIANEMKPEAFLFLFNKINEFLSTDTTLVNKDEMINFFVDKLIDGVN